MILALLALSSVKARNGMEVQPKRVAMAYCVPIFIFAGSFVFHATLTYFGQLLDELPMIYGSLFFLYMLSDRQHEKIAQRVMILLGAMITYTMVHFRESPLPLQISYGCLSTVLFLRSVVIAQRIGHATSSKFLLSGTACYLIAFMFWLLDQNYCEIVQGMYFHAWWHLFSGMGGYLWIQFLCAHEVLAVHKSLVISKIGFGIPFCNIPEALKTN